MAIKGMLLAAFLAAALSACAIPVRTDYESATAVAVCHSFAWQDALPQTNAGAFDNPLNGKRLRNAVAIQLQAHGLSAAADPAHADCLVSAAVGSRTAADDAPVAWGAGFGWGYRRYGGVMGWDADAPYQQGSVAVDLYEAKTHEPLWHAAAQRDVTQLSGSDAEQEINRTVQALFAHFPAPTP